VVGEGVTSVIFFPYTEKWWVGKLFYMGLLGHSWTEKLSFVVALSIASWSFERRATKERLGMQSDTEWSNNVDE
jgi:hypothetical protein